MKLFLILSLLPLYLLGYECSDKKKVLILDGITIQKSDKKYGYELSCKSIERVYDGYAKDKEIETVKINNGTDLIISDRKIFSLKKVPNRLTISVALNSIQPNFSHKHQKDGYFCPIKNEFYYLLTFDKNGNYIVSESEKKVQVINNLQEKIELSRVFKNIDWYKGNNVVPKDKNVSLVLTNIINTEQKDELKNYIKITLADNAIILSKKESYFSFVLPKEKVIDPLDLKSLVFDGEENNFSINNPINSISEFQKFQKLDNNKKNHIKGKLCIDSVSFEEKYNKFNIQTKYCRVKESSISISAAAYQNDFDKKSVEGFYEGKSIDLNVIKHLSPNPKIKLILNDNENFSFNEDNKVLREHNKTINLVGPITVKLYPTFTKELVPFECRTEEIDTSGNQFKEKKSSFVNTKEKIILPNSKEITCGDKIEVRLDKNSSIESFITNVKGFGKCKKGLRSYKIASICSKSDINLLLAYVPFSKSQFIQKLEKPRGDLLIIEEFFVKLKKESILKKYGNRLFVKNTNSFGKIFNSYFDKSFKADVKYPNIKTNINNTIEKVFNTNGNVGVLYFSYLDRNEITNLFCKSNFDNKAILFNFNVDMDASSFCNKVKVINMSNNNKIGRVELEKKLNDSITEVVEYLKGE